MAVSAPLAERPAPRAVAVVLLVAVRQVRAVEAEQVMGGLGGTGAGRGGAGTGAVTVGGPKKETAGETTPTPACVITAHMRVVPVRETGSPETHQTRM